MLKYFPFYVNDNLQQINEITISTISLVAILFVSIVLL